MIDVRKVQGDKAFIVSKNTLEWAQEAIKKCQYDGEYKNLFADDASFLLAALTEIEAALSHKE